MKFFSFYLKEKRMEIFLFLLFSVIFFAVFLLYHLPLKAVAYPFFLCAVFGVLFFLFDFHRKKRKYEYFSRVRDLQLFLACDLPQPESIAEAEYFEMINTVRREVMNLKTETNRKYQEMIEYYTGWVHQVKTPIFSMRLALQNEDSPLARRCSTDLFRIEQYVEMVLVFLRLDENSNDYVFQTHCVDSIIRQSVKKFVHEFIDRKITLQYEPIEENVVTDEKWLSFVIEQLLSNALKYTKEGRIRIYWEAPKTLCISDTGIGISSEDLPRIFDRGYTGYNGRKDRTASGLGLYLCRRICGNLGFKISAESVLNQGTVMRIRMDQKELKQE